MKRGVIGVLLALLVSGCASVPRDAGLADVRQTVAERTNQTIQARDRAIEGDVPEIQSLLSGELDADRAVAVALANNPRLQVVLAELGFARAELLEASTVSNPIFHGEIRFPGDPKRPYELSVTQSLLELVQLPRRRRVGRSVFEAAKLRVSAEVLRFAAEVREDFYDLLGETRKLAMSRTAAESARVSAELAQRQHAAGNITDLDLENQQALYEEAKLDLARTEEEVLVAREALIRDMGLRRADAEWTIQSDFPALPTAELDPAQIEAVVAARRLDIAALRREIEAARGALPLARTEGIGDIAADVHHEREPDGTKTTGPGIEFPIPIFNRGAAARARAEARLRRAEQQLAEAMAAATSEARAARERLIAARARVEYYRDVLLPRRRRIVELTQLEHNAMLVGIFQLLQARQDEAEARRESVEAQRDYWIARSQFDRALNGVSEVAMRGGH
jgi:cobalt-zinc-cadmium efflux system outer membrane protein